MLKYILNGYYFIGTEENGLYNSTISLKFLELLQTKPKKIYDMIDQQVNMEEWLLVLSDKNVVTPESVLNIISNIPQIDIVHSDLSTYNYFPIGGPISNVFTSKDMFYAGNMTKLNLLYSFLFYHGILTIYPRFDSDILMKIPNQMRYYEFLPRLLDKVNFDSQMLYTLNMDPSEANMKNFLWSILSNVKTLYDNLFDELSLQAVLEVGISRITNGIMKMQIEASKNYFLKKGNRESDLIFYTKGSNTVFLLELKRVRPNAIDYVEKENKKKFGDEVNWYRNQYVENRQYLQSLTEEQLENFKIREKYQYQNGLGSVKQIISRATDQVSNYANLLQKEPYMQEKTIHKYVVVQVGYPIIVKKI